MPQAHLPGMALLADGAAEGNKGGRADVDGICSESDGLGHIAGVPHPTGHDDGSLVADAFLPQP